MWLLTFVTIAQRLDRGAYRMLRRGAESLDTVNPLILRTGFLAERSVDTPKKGVLGKTVALPISSRRLHAIAVQGLPKWPRPNAVYMLLNDRRRESLSMHNLVRFPAKLHQPFVAWAIERFTEPGDTILDPFCGCGTVCLEATLRGRQAIGFDVDPYSALVATAKCSPPTQRAFSKVVESLKLSISEQERNKATYDRLAKTDISVAHYRRQLRALSAPRIPRIEHWFKRYVLIDLLRIWRAVRRRRGSAVVKRYLRAAFVSILRLCSNADPDTLSGLEVTKRMRKWMRRGRRLNPYKIFVDRLERNLDPILTKFWKRRKKLKRPFSPRVRTSSAVDARSYRTLAGRIDAIITSPPYCSAVEYYRRHLLEHYWLGFITSEEQGATIRRRYIGRRNYVYGSASELLDLLPRDVGDRLRRYLGSIPQQGNKENRRIRSIVKYFVEMSRWFKLAAKQLRSGGRLIMVIGDSTVRGRPIRTSELLKRLTPPELRLENQFSYVLRNRSMQYSRWNEADVATENVIIFTRV